MFAASLGTGSAVFQILWKIQPGSNEKALRSEGVYLSKREEGNPREITQDVLKQIWNRIKHQKSLCLERPAARRQPKCSRVKRSSAKRESLPAHPRRAQHRLRKPRQSSQSRIHDTRARKYPAKSAARPGITISVNTKSSAPATIHKIQRLIPSARH